jgi:hypothetical protein
MQPGLRLGCDRRILSSIAPGSAGAWSEQESRFIERMPTAAGTLLKQQRNLVDDIVQVCTTKLNKRPAP